MTDIMANIIAASFFAGIFALVIGWRSILDALLVYGMHKALAVLLGLAAIVAITILLE